MFGSRKADELDNLWDAYLNHGELEYSEQFELIQNEFYKFFELLLVNNVIPQSKYFDLEEKLGDLVCESANQAFRQGFTKEMDLRSVVITVIQGGKNEQ